MKPIDFPQANVKMIAPVGQEDRVYSMFAHRTDDGRTISCWTLDDKELAMISESKQVWLSIMGNMPPLSLIAETPYTDTSLHQESKRQEDVENIMETLRQNKSTIMLGNSVQTVTLTMDEFEYVIGALPYMLGASRAKIQEVSSNIDTIIIGLSEGRMIIVRR